MSASDTPALKVEGLVKHFPVFGGLFRRKVGEVSAVDGVSVTIPARSTVALVGESGCGKTTAARAMLRLIEPDGGKIWFDGVDLRTLGPAELRKARRHLQMVFQDPYGSLNPRQTILEIIGGPMLLHDICPRPQVEQKVAELLEIVGLQARYLSRYPHEFSGGQRQRIGIARAVALKPRLIVCDEAVAALDVSVRAQVLNLLLELQQKEHLSYLFVTHDLSVVRHIADRVVVMYLGRVVEEAPTEAIFRRPCHPYTQALLSAAPDPRPGQRARRIQLEGEIPSPRNPPSGCRFHTRCPLASSLGGRCAAEVPTPREVAPGQVVACHLYDNRTEPVELSRS